MSHRPRLAPGQVRIIGGQWRRRLLPVPSGKGMPEGLRPTPDRVRETLFNWLGQDLGGWKCLDLCAGTGALGFEAASRGAAVVRMVEQHAGLVRHLQEQARLLQATAVAVRQGDARAVLAGGGERYDLVLLDPPYASDWYADAVRLAQQAVADEGYLYLEAGREWTEADLLLLGWQRVRHLKAGQVHAHLLRPLREPVG